MGTPSQTWTRPRACKQKRLLHTQPGRHSKASTTCHGHGGTGNQGHNTYETREQQEGRIGGRDMAPNMLGRRAHTLKHQLHTQPGGHRKGSGICAGHGGTGNQRHSAYETGGQQRGRTGGRDMAPNMPNMLYMEDAHHGAGMEGRRKAPVTKLPRDQAYTHACSSTTVSLKHVHVHVDMRTHACACMRTHTHCMHAIASGVRTVMYHLAPPDRPHTHRMHAQHRCVTARGRPGSGAVR